VCVGASLSQFTAEIDRRIIEESLDGWPAMSRSLVRAGFSSKAVKERALSYGLSASFLTDCRERGVSPKARRCLNCERLFVSIGFGNRLCKRCRSMSNPFK